MARSPEAGTPEQFLRTSGKFEAGAGLVSILVGLPFGTPLLVLGGISYASGKYIEHRRNSAR